VDRPTLGTFDAELVTHASTVRFIGFEYETPVLPTRAGRLPMSGQAVALARLRRTSSVVLTIRNNTATPIISVDNA
ncbi:hypothetical protein MAAFP003_2629, partial [Mycobacterium ahvazicum]